MVEGFQASLQASGASGYFPIYLRLAPFPRHFQPTSSEDLCGLCTLSGASMERAMLTSHPKAPSPRVMAQKSPVQIWFMGPVLLLYIIS